jgi:hypothetical protein
MGTTISMDVSANLQDGATNGDTVSSSTQQTMTFEDKLRQEIILVPEDLSDIHIESPYTNTGDTDTTAETAETAENPRRNPRRNPRNKKHGVVTTTSVPFQTERTIEQRRAQVRPIMDKLTELQMNVSYPSIRELYKQLQLFVKTGEDAKIKIPFPEFSRKIRGELSNATYKPCWVRLELD